ncbi:uncharacterized protein LOC144132467 isoform X1 [Amblyomma americanum]
MSSSMLSTTLLIFAACAGVSKVEEMQGAPSNVSPYSDPKYYHLAEYALSERPLKVNSRYVTVLELTSASKQLVAGFIYRVNFTTAVTSCRRCYKMHKCTPISDKIWRKISMQICRSPDIRMTSTKVMVILLRKKHSSWLYS